VPSVLANVLSPTPGAIAGVRRHVLRRRWRFRRRTSKATPRSPATSLRSSTRARQRSTRARTPRRRPRRPHRRRRRRSRIRRSRGPNTNLAGVFEINDISKVRGLARTFHSWIVTSPGFFGKGVQATLTVYAVNGSAPAVVDGSEKPISNVVRESFTIAG
jgi:hypothetical protein